MTHLTDWQRGYQAPVTDIAAHIARHTTASHRQVQDLIERAKAAGADPEHVIHYHPADALIVLRLMSEASVIERVISRPSADAVCGWGTCSLYVEDGKIVGGLGVPLCGCDNLPGWNSPYPAGTPKPQAPVKARGRHGSRVQRSTRRRREWRRMCAEYGSEARQ